MPTMSESSNSNGTNGNTNANGTGKQRAPLGLPPKTPAKKSTTAAPTAGPATANPGTNSNPNPNAVDKNNPLGISPPGMRLRSGRKKAPTPTKEILTRGHTPGKRRRDDDDDGVAGDDGMDGNEGRTKRRALNFEDKLEKVQDKVQDKDVEMTDGANDADAEQTVDLTDSAAAAAETAISAEEMEPEAPALPQAETTTTVTTTAESTSMTKTPDKSITSPPPIQLQVNNLHLPSEQTPAPQKVDAKYAGTARLRDFITPAKPSMRSIASPSPLLAIPADKDEIVNGTDGVVDGNGSSGINGAGTDSEVEGLGLKMPKGVEVEQEEEERDEGRRDGLFRYFTRREKDSEDATDTMVYLGVILCLHLYLMFIGGTGLFAPFWAWKNAPIIANQALMRYRAWGVYPEPVIPPKPDPIKIEKVVENIVWDDNEELAEKERELLRNRRMIAWWKAQKEIAAKDIQDFEDLVAGEMGHAESIMAAIDSQKEGYEARLEDLDDWEAALEHSRDALAEYASWPKEDINAAFDGLMESSEIAIDVNDLQVVSFAQVAVPGEDCNGQDFIMVENKSDEDEEYVQEEDVAKAKAELKSLVQSTFSEIRFDPESMKPIEAWMQSALDEFTDEYMLYQPLDLSNIIAPERSAVMDSDNSTGEGLTITEIQAIIDEAIEVLKADGTGKHDYASLRAGSNVIYSGPRQTSPSLVENLPLGNQLMAKLGLRFYGHGANAALEPTFPRDSLGQCWSFEREGDRKRITIKELASEEDEMANDPDRGEYATLAVQLARPIFVKSVAIEHAQTTVSNNRGTAIRQFRVIGYQDEEASGEPWLLGEFQFNSKSKEPLQEFEVATELENGLPIPRLGAVVLAIDSNWGAEYSCLYRFRVHGHNKLSS